MPEWGQEQNSGLRAASFEPRCLPAVKPRAARCRLLRAVALQLSHPHVLRSLLRSATLSFSEMLMALMYLSLTNLLSWRTG